MRRTQGVGLFTQNWLEYTQQWFRELVLQVVFRINGDVVLQDVNRVLRLLIRSGPYSQISPVAARKYFPSHYLWSPSLSRMVLDLREPEQILGQVLGPNSPEP